MGTGSGDSRLASALFGKTRRAVLALLFARPDESFYLRQIAGATGVGLGAVQRELQGLTEAGILRRTRRGRHVYYQANPDCPILDELSGLVRKTVGLADVLRDALAPLAEKGEIELALVFGSRAGGSATADSDVDLLVVGDVGDVELHRAVQQAERALGRTVDYTHVDKRELRRRRKSGGFLARVLKGPKIVIVGDPRAL